MTVAAVPWARHGAGHTRDFDDLAAWLAVRTSKSAVMELLRVAWRTVGSIVTRVNADIDATVDRLDGLRRIGIDEISYKRGHRYLRRRATRSARSRCQRYRRIPIGRYALLPGLLSGELRRPPHVRIVV